MYNYTSSVQALSLFLYGHLVIQQNTFEAAAVFNQNCNPFFSLEPLHVSCTDYVCAFELGWVIIKARFSSFGVARVVTSGFVSPLVEQWVRSFKKVKGEIVSIALKAIEL